jgi:hypothetical protein
MPDAASPPPRDRAVGRNLFDLVNVPLLLIVAACFFLPLCQLNCEMIHVRFDGLNLAMGTAPTVDGPKDGPTSADLQQEMRKEKIPLDPWLLVWPLAALLGAAASLVAFRHPRAGRRRYLMIAPALVMLILLIAISHGFGIERYVAQKSAQGHDSADTRITTEKTPWFYIVLAASAGALVLSGMRAKSPTILGTGYSGQGPLAGARD